MIVVDASVAVQWVVPEQGSEHSDTLLGRDDLIAPGLLLIEAANALRRKIAAGDVRLEQAQLGLGLIDDSLSLLPVDVSLTRDALALSNAISHPVYDCVYLALALRDGARFVSHDQQLMRRLERHGFGHVVATLPLDEESRLD